AARASDGAALHGRIHHERELDHLRVPPHIVRLARACWTLGGEPALTGLRLRQGAHMLGFRGHWATKSRRYSSTLGAPRPPCPTSGCASGRPCSAPGATGRQRAAATRPPSARSAVPEPPTPRP